MTALGLPADFVAIAEYHRKSSLDKEPRWLHTTAMHRFLAVFTTPSKIILGKFLLPFSLLSAQAPPPLLPVSPSASPTKPVIDGRSSPELVPDSIAISLFLRAVAEPPGASASARKRMSVKLTSAGLSSHDVQKVLPLLDSFYERAELTDRRVATIYLESGGHALTASSRELVKSLRATFQAFTIQTFSRMLAEVSNAEELRLHIQKIKVKMKAYSLPDMQGDDYHKH